MGDCLRPGCAVPATPPTASPDPRSWRRPVRPAACARSSISWLRCSQAASTWAAPPSPRLITSCAIERCRSARSSPSAVFAKLCQWLSAGSASICWRSLAKPRRWPTTRVHFAHLIERRACVASAISAMSSAANRPSALATRLRQRQRHAGPHPVVGARRAASPLRASRSRSASTAGAKRLNGLLHRLGQPPRAQEPRGGARDQPARLDQHLGLHCVGHLVVQRLDLLPQRHVAEDLARRQVGAHDLRAARAGRLDQPVHEGAPTRLTMLLSTWVAMISRLQRMARDVGAELLAQRAGK